MKNWRINLILFFLFLSSSLIVGRLVYLQIIQKNYWQALAQGQQKFFTQIQNKRGEVFLQSSLSSLSSLTVPLAINRNFSLVYISPKEVEKSKETAEILSKILNLNENLILEKINKKESFYELIKNKLTEEEVSNLKKLNLPGVYLTQETLRYYPQESLASQVIGFFNSDGKGQYGIEEYYDQILRGQERGKGRFEEGEWSPWGSLIKKLKGNIQKGSDLILTIDYNIQFFAEKLLQEAKEILNIEGGQIIVIDPHSGKILALVNFPNFNPNQYSEVENLEIFQNSVIQKIFEPGSIFKPLTMAASLEEGKITPQTTYIDEGKVKIGGHTIYNYDYKIWGKQTMTQVLENSINTGAVFIERQLDHQLFLKYIEKFGIFEKTEIDLSGEVFSQNKEFKKGYEINFATASFGQGIEMTPLQIVRAFSAIANGGKLIKPYLVEKIIINGKEINISPKISNHFIISQQTASQLTTMLVSAVENGYGKRAKISGYYIAGKTGTSQIPFSSLGIDKAGYSDKTWQSFIGFAPAYNPYFLILIKLDNPQTKVAGLSTTIIARDLIKYILDYYQIPPDYE